MTQMITDTLKADRRWQRLHDATFMRQTFGVSEAGFFSFNLAKPSPWQGGAQQDASDPALDPQNFLIEDFCVIDGTRHFIRAVLEFPILGAKGSFVSFSLWVEVSGAHFERYGDTFSLTNQADMGTFPARIANRLATFEETEGVACTVFPQNGSKRPLLAIDDESHPVGEAQRKGITFDHALEFYEASGFAISKALSA